ncbi:MAG: glycerol-3-phosphate dehydrogenase, partial [Hyphomicrobiales bacterium]|nr:glycerol-3-phosphate dehydrogenase [Hyphomicrobiales bacterium]
MPTSSYDLFVIGGGINGCGIARDAVGRGLRTGLAEMGDLAQGTSSASTKLIHGGLRYLENYEFRLVREALREREVLLRIAPHIVRPMRFVLPFTAGMRPRWMLRMGLFLYDHIAGRLSLPASQQVDLTARPLGGALRREYATGFEYSDCSVDDSRLVIINARDAAQRGADILTRTRVVSARREQGEWTVLLQMAAGGTRTVRAAMLVNAA